MSNKLKIKGDVRRFGNFIIEFFKGKIEKVEIRTVANNFSLKYSQTHPTFQLLRDAVDAKADSYIEVWLTAMYATCTGVKDNIFFEKVFEAVKNQQIRLHGEEELTEEEDQVILSELKDKHEQNKNI